MEDARRSCSAETVDLATKLLAALQSSSAPFSVDLDLLDDEEKGVERDRGIMLNYAPSVGNWLTVVVFANNSIWMSYRTGHRILPYTGASDDSTRIAQVTAKFWALFPQFSAYKTT